MIVADTSGDEDYDRLRPLSYLDADLVLLCFSFDSKASLANINEKWLPEIRHLLPLVPVILIGTKADLKQNQGICDHHLGQNEMKLFLVDGISCFVQIKQMTMGCAASEVTKASCCP